MALHEDPQSTPVPILSPALLPSRGNSNPSRQPRQQSRLCEGTPDLSRQSHLATCPLGVPDPLPFRWPYLGLRWEFGVDTRDMTRPRRRGLSDEPSRLPIGRLLAVLQPDK